MYSSKEAMMASIAAIDRQIASLKTTVAGLRAQKKTYTAMKTESGRNTAKSIQNDIEQRMRQIKNLQDQKKACKAQGYRK